MLLGSLGPLALFVILETAGSDWVKSGYTCDSVESMKESTDVASPRSVQLESDPKCCDRKKDRCQLQSKVIEKYAAVLCLAPPHA